MAAVRHEAPRDSGAQTAARGGQALNPLALGQPEEDQGRARYVPAIDGLRAVAVLTVMAFHLRPDLLPGGFVGVDIFFVISGFVVTGSVLRVRLDRPRQLIAYFYARRLVRIVPALAVMLAGAALLTVLFIPNASVMTSSRGVALGAAAGAGNLVLALAGDAYFGPGADHDPFLHTWTLGVEEQFYLLFPFVLLLYWRARSQARERVFLVFIALVSVLSFALWLWLARSAPLLSFYLMPARFWELGTGMALALTSGWWIERLRSAARLPIVAIQCLAFAALLAALLSVRGASLGLLPNPLAVLSAAALILLVTGRPDVGGARILAVRGTIYVGRISYSLYLWHWPVIVLLRWTTGLEGVAAPAIALALAFCAAVASFHWVEQPARRWGRSASVPRGTAIRSGLILASASACAIWALFAAEGRLSLSRAQFSRVNGAPILIRGCPVAQSRRPVEGGEVLSWLPRCALGARRLIVAGDSHALAYVWSLQRYATERAVPVTLYYRFDCAFPPIIVARDGIPACAAFEAAVARELRAGLRAGDVLFMPALRVSRLQPDGSAAAPRISATAHAEARALLSSLASTGADLILEAPTPLFPSPAYRCSDWFNRANAACRGGLAMSRQKLLELRAPVMAEMALLAGEVQHVRVWDPFPILCPGDPCTAWRGETLLMFDTDHLTGPANDLLYPSLVETVESPAFLPAAG